MSEKQLGKLFGLAACRRAKDVREFSVNQKATFQFVRLIGGSGQPKAGQKASRFMGFAGLN